MKKRAAPARGMQPGALVMKTSVGKPLPADFDPDKPLSGKKLKLPTLAPDKKGWAAWREQQANLKATQPKLKAKK